MKKLQNTLKKVRQSLFKDLTTMLTLLILPKSRISKSVIL